MQYYGGHVISNVKVIEVLYGSGAYAPEIIGSQMGTFYTQVVQSPFVDWLSEYDTNITAVGGQQGTNQHIGRGSFGGKVTIKPSTSGSSVDDTAIQSELAAQISSGALPAPDANTLYMLHFPNGLSITQGGTGSCVSGGFCAYHGTFTRNGASVYYGVLPDMSAGSGCDTGCGNDPTPFNNQTSVASHEFTEAITDAEVGLATGNAPPLAWYDQTNGEIGDICNAQQGNFVGSDGATYVVQQEWSNAQQACVDHGTTTTPPALSTAITAPAGGSTVSGSVKITATASTGANKIELYVDGTLLATGTKPPFSANWDTTQVADGSHQLTSQAYDSAGNTATSAAVAVTVSNNGGTALSTSITAPTDGSTLAGSVTVTATASSGANKIELYVDGTLFASGTTSPFSAAWDTTQVSDGSHQLTSKADDAAGSVATSAAVTVTVSNGGGTVQCPPGTTNVGGTCVPTGGTGCSTNSGGATGLASLLLAALALTFSRRRA